MLIRSGGIYGEALERSEYLPFGASRWGSGAEVTRYRFTDQERDLHTGFYNYDARLYDPALGRFASPDSMLPDPYDPQQLNRYVYCRNNPLVYVDPTGHEASEAETDPNPKEHQDNAKAQGPQDYESAVISKLKEAYDRAKSCIDEGISFNALGGTVSFAGLAISGNVVDSAGVNPSGLSLDVTTSAAGASLDVKFDVKCAPAPPKGFFDGLSFYRGVNRHLSVGYNPDLKQATFSYGWGPGLPAGFSMPVDAFARALAGAIKSNLENVDFNSRRVRDNY